MISEAPRQSAGYRLTRAQRVLLDRLETTSALVPLTHQEKATAAVLVGLGLARCDAYGVWGVER